MKPLHVQPGREKRLLRGHRWIFSNEVTEPLSDYEPGSWVEVFSAKGVLLGSGYINSKSLIAVRLVCQPGQKPTQEFFHSLIEKAFTRRSQLFYPGSDSFRVIYGESDGLPGLIVDRYGDVLVYQITTLGMARLEPLIQQLLRDILRPKALVYRHDTRVRTLEGLPLEKGVAFGDVPAECRVRIEDLQMRIDLFKGQKTGLYLDQRDNRNALRPWVKGRRVLDVFCYNGAWSLTAAVAGAREVVGVDQSSEAIAQARHNAVDNHLEDRCHFKEEEAFRFLKSVDRGAFDIIILDPPAFAKTKSAIPEARKGYTDLNRRALLALKSGGMLVSCSCSYHVDDSLFQEILLQAAQASGRRLRLLEARSQAKDHPVLLAMPETRYLKCYFLEVV